MLDTLLAKKQTNIYLKCYMLILTIIFSYPILYGLTIGLNIYLYALNIYLYEINMFFSLVLMVYTYLTRNENRYWKTYSLYFILSLSYLVITMICLQYHFYI